MTPEEQDGRPRVQAEKPVSPTCIEARKSLQPWERPGACRRDCQPHRAGLLFRVAEASVVLVIFSWCFGLPLLVAFPLGFVTWLAARHDLALMRKGLMDRRGEVQTLEARCVSELVLVFCGGVGVFVVGYMLLSSSPGLPLLVALCACLWGVPVACWLFWLTVKAVL